MGLAPPLSPLLHTLLVPHPPGGGEDRIGNDKFLHLHLYVQYSYIQVALKFHISKYLLTFIRHIEFAKPATSLQQLQ